MCAVPGNRELAVVILSGSRDYPTDNHVEHPREGGLAHVYKPFFSPLLLTSVVNLLKQYGSNYVLSPTSFSVISTPDPFPLAS